MQPNLTQLIDDGLAIVNQIAQLETQLKSIELQIEQAALHGEQRDLNDPDRDGKQFLAAGTDQTVPVVLTSDIITQSFGEGTVIHARAEAIIGAERLREFYRPVTAWRLVARSGKAFRREAAGILGPEKAGDFVAAVIARDRYGVPKSQIRIEWKRSAPHNHFVTQEDPA